MRNRLLVFVLAGILSTIWMSACAKQRRSAKLKLEKCQYELGILYKTDSVYCLTIPFKNVGDGDLVFEDIEPDCPCIHIAYDKKAYPAKSKGKIELKFDLSIPPQEMDKGIYIYSNASPLDTSIEVRFHGFLKASRQQ
jgi:hypothetical protein